MAANLKARKAQLAFEQTSLPRLPIDVYVPLTEELDFDGSTGTAPLPPIMAVASGSFHERGNIGDRLQAVVIGAQHPIQSKDWPDFLGEQGYDPLLSSETFDGAYIPIRIDGVVGLTQSEFAESAEQRRAAVLMSMDETALPDDARKRIGHWPFARIQIRRYRDPMTDEQVPPAVTSVDGAVSGRTLWDLSSLRDDGRGISVTMPVGAESKEFTFIVGQLAHADGSITEDRRLSCIASLATPRANGTDTPNLVMSYSGKYPINGRNKYSWTSAALNMSLDDCVDSAEDGYLRVIASAVGESRSGRPKGLCITISATSTVRIRDSQRLGFDPWLHHMPVYMDVPEGQRIFLDAPLIETAKSAPIKARSWQNNGDTVEKEFTRLNGDKGILNAIVVSPFTDPVWCQFTPDTSRFFCDTVDKTVTTLRTEQLAIRYETRGAGLDGYYVVRRDNGDEIANIKSLGVPFDNNDPFEVEQACYV